MPLLTRVTFIVSTIAITLPNLLIELDAPQAEHVLDGKGNLYSIKLAFPLPSYLDGAQILQEFVMNVTRS